MKPSQCIECGAPCAGDAQRCRACYRALVARPVAPKKAPPVEPNPSGLCMCGCGKETPLATRSNRHKGKLRGKPTRFISGHYRPPTEEYVVDSVTQCWNWAGATTHGYGKTTVNGVSVAAHRYMWEKLRGPIPEGLQLDHLCRNRSCVNPDHLEPVTNAENARRGAGAKLSYSEAEAIRKMAGTVPCKEIASRFGVGQTAIRKIIRGDSWS